MNKFTVLFFFSICLILSQVAYSETKFQGPDFSGQYTCVGDDFKEGKYQGLVTIKLIPQHSTQTYGAYQFELSVAGFGKYPGHAAAFQHTMAIYFANTQHDKNHDFGTGIANFSKNAKGKWTFKKFYYEPEFKGGNHGFETCTQQ